MLNFNEVTTTQLITVTIGHIRKYHLRMGPYVQYVKYNKNQNDWCLERHYADLNALEDCIDICLRELQRRNATIPNKYMQSYLNDQKKRESTLK